MAESKSLEELKIVRTTAKRLFSRLTNHIRRTHMDMSVEELQDSFKRLTAEGSKVIDVNEELEAAYITQCEAEGTPELMGQQRADVEKTEKECEQKLKEAKHLIRETLWTSYGERELTLALKSAEMECENVSSTQPDTPLEVYDFMLHHLEELVKKAKQAHQTWNRWAPPAERRDCDRRLMELETCLPKLVSGKAALIKAERIKRDADQAVVTVRNAAPVAAIKLKATALPKFTGSQCEFYRWRKEWEALQKQGEPTGSMEVKKFQLLDSLDDKVAKDLRLSTYTSADEIFRVLENHYGNQATIAIEIIEELQAIPPVRSNQPRRIIELIHAVGKALYDLNELDKANAIKNLLVIKSIESKLPESLKKDWLTHAADPKNAVTHQNRFDKLLAYLQSQESIYEQLDQLRDVDPAKERTKFPIKYARTKSVKSSTDPAGCIICGDPKHKRKLYICRRFRTNTKLQEKKDAVQQLGACKRCLEIHDEPCRKTTYLCGNPECKDQHHYLLCPLPRPLSQRPKSGPVRAEGRRYTEVQEEFISKLSPELAQQCRKAFCNVASRAFNSMAAEKGLLEETGLKEYPVILMLLDVIANDGQRIGTLIDLASDTNYITHKAASKLNLRSEDVMLVIQGVGGMKVSVATKCYLLKIRVNTSRGTLKPHQLVCYGLDKIAEVERHVPPQKLQKIFPDVSLQDLIRPREIQLLISHKEGQLVPQKIRSIGDLVLWDGPLGKTIGGTHPDLFEEVTLMAHTSKTHFARSMRAAAFKYQEFTKDLASCQRPDHPETLSTTATSSRDFLKWWRWESIGAACQPRCGGCRCGNCQPGGKEMTLAEEREMEIVRNGLNYSTGDDHSSEPHWHAKYPWVEDPAALPNNRKAVEATFIRTEMKLSKEPEWRTAYAAQVHEMVNRRAAVKLSKEVLQSWTGPVWYISHLIAPNPHSVSTPVRLVWNSSQKYRGLSLNDILIKGPDVLNPIRAVLLRFRAGVYAALGDIRKMYNSVWLEDREVHLHRFLWRDTEDAGIEDYAITRVNIGDKPAGCIAQVAMRETANLPSFSHFKEEKRVLEEDAYVDDILTSHNDLDHLRRLTANIERILRAGGFYMKPWVYSSQSGREEAKKELPRSEAKTIILPNQLTEDDNKALGLGYTINDDKLHVMVAVNFSKKRRKMRLGQDLLREEVRERTPDPLTRRELLSQVSGLYDPLGLVTPVKQKGAILLLEEYADLKKLHFTRALTPPDPCAEPSAITFSDGSEHAYGAVMYLRWHCNHSVIVRLVESKAKLTPLNHKGYPVKAEMCGAVFAARLKTYFQRHCRIQVKKWYHLVDSQTVLGAIQRESYGFQTFFANRVGEIQSSTNVQDWWWIPGSANIADILTRGASPNALTEDSKWQSGPKFLQLSGDEWLKKSAGEVAAQAREKVTKLQKKAFVAALTRIHTNAAQDSVHVESRRPLAGVATQQVIDERRFSNLRRLIGTVAWVWRVAKKFMRSKTRDQEKWEVVPSSGVLTVNERRDAFRDLCLAAQEGVNFPSTTTDRLVVYRDQTSGLLVCGGRIQTFKEDRRAVPLLPFQAWLSTLLAREAHSEGHDGVAGTLLRMRMKAWVVRGRIIAQKVVDQCIICKKTKARICKQVMGDLPEERSNPAAPFEFTAVDLFGPYHVRDDVKRRVTMKVWGVVFCCMASRAIHVELASTLSTESFLLAYQRFTSVRGHPRKIWSDPGTNFVGAKPVLEEMYAYLRQQNKESLEEYSAKNETTWAWKILPADSPHRNGAAEAAVRVTKRALHTLGNVEALIFSEFLTALQLAANLANERPIDARIQSREDRIDYITPNNLLLGRATQSGDFKTIDFTNYPFKRLKEVQTMVNNFWRSWSQLAGPNLFIRSKWHTAERNIALADIVWLCDQNALRGQFRLARVISVNPDSRGIVRDVQVRVSPSSSIAVKSPKSATRSPELSTILHRDIRRLVVLLPVEDQARDQPT
ncbi:unnamed protein product [Oreochromis niloticus]|nr:unnamed protein product [Mustela putorius furo]